MFGLFVFRVMPVNCDKTLASMFRLKENEYRRFMDFLRRNDCLLDFRPYRKAADNAS
ncbi:MAG TPA: hypothetical protein VE422_28585 [Terriglobia bacterium]|nr:hypothetical protein [Terriglobia bacterium]